MSVTTLFRPPGSLRQSLVHPKDRVPKGKKTNVVYRAVCGVCGDDYVGETQQPLAERVHQHTHTAAGQHRTQWIWRALRSLKGNRTGEGEALER